MKKILFNSGDFFETIGSDFECITYLYEAARKNLSECYDEIIDDIECEKLYIIKENNKNIIVLEDSPFIYKCYGRDAANIPIITYQKMKISGKTYQEKQSFLEDMAKEWQHDFSYHNYAWGDLAEIGEFFAENAKRYGLITEFKNNAII